MNEFGKISNKINYWKLWWIFYKCK